MEDHDCVAVLLGREFEEVEEFGVVVEVADGVVDDWFPGRAQLGVLDQNVSLGCMTLNVQNAYLTRMGRQSMTQFGSHSSSFC